MDKKYVSIGTILKPHGLGGELKARIKYQWKSAHNYPGHFFIEQNGIYLPYFVEKFHEPVQNQSIIKFQSLRTREDVLRLGRAVIYLEESMVDEFLEDASGPFGRLTGYAAIDQKAGDFGEIEEVIEMPAQHVALVVHSSGKEILVPLVDEIIEEIDDAGKQVTFNLPEGLLELYTE